MLRKRSSGSVRIVSLDRQEAIRRLKGVAERIRASHPEAAEILLFGSLARGSHVGTSDADVLIVLEGSTTSDPASRILEFLPEFDLPIGVDLIVLTRAELESRLEDADPFVTRIIDEGIPL